MKRSVYVTVTLVAGTIAFVCLRTLLLFTSTDHVRKRADTTLDQLGYYQWPKRSEIYPEESDLDVDGVHTTGLVNLTAEQRQEWIVANLPNFQILQSDDKSRLFSERVNNFLQGLGDGVQDVMSLKSLNGSELVGGLGENQKKAEKEEKYLCDINIFMIWIPPVSRFGPREQLSVESIFKTHPSACLVILSRSLDSEEGKRKVLQQFLDRGFQVLAVTPDIPQLFEGTTASIWYDRLRKGTIDPGHMSLSQNLSNLMRLVALYKYGGLYLDMDIIVLRNFSALGNAIGSQHNDVDGSWITLDNAVMKFSKGHPVMLKCIQEFASSFNGSKWGHNGPLLMTRMLSGLQKHYPQGNEWQCDILPPSVFYPVDWVHIPVFLLAPRSHSDKLRHISTIQNLETNSFTLHLWNEETRGFKVQSGSILDTIYRDRCVICNETILQSALAIT